MVVIAIPMGIIALLSIPYFWLYPDRHAHVADGEGTDAEKARLLRWRNAYRQLSFIGRVQHARKRSRRLRRRAA
jgi:hypothetical protein